MRPFYELRDPMLVCNERTKFSVRAHLHDQIEIVYLREGECTVRVDDGIYPATAGDVFVVFPHQIHAITDHTEVRGAILIFSPDLLGGVRPSLRSVVPTTPKIPAGDARDRIVFFLTQLEREMAQKEVGSEEVRRGLLSCIVGESLRALPLTASGGANTLLLRKIVDYVYAHYTEPITLDGVSKELFVSKYYVSYLFSSKMHIGFSSFVSSLRVSDACRYLEASERVKMSEVAEAVGFSSLRTFNRVFRDVMGVTPSEYREAKEK